MPKEWKCLHSHGVTGARAAAKRNMGKVLAALPHGVCADHGQRGQDMPTTKPRGSGAPRPTRGISAVQETSYWWALHLNGKEEWQSNATENARGDLFLDSAEPRLHGIFSWLRINVLKPPFPGMMIISWVQCYSKTLLLDPLTSENSDDRTATS